MTTARQLTHADAAIKQLQRERDELRAEVDRLREAIKSMPLCPAGCRSKVKALARKALEDK